VLITSNHRAEGRQATDYERLRALLQETRGLKPWVIRLSPGEGQRQKMTVDGSTEEQFSAQR